jgi:glutaredoxin
MRRVDVVLYGRPGCHLCDEARGAIAEIAAGGPWDVRLREVDIERDDDLFRRYLERIPVVAVDGEVVSELIPDRSALRERIATVAADGQD